MSLLGVRSTLKTEGVVFLILESQMAPTVFIDSPALIDAHTHLQDPSIWANCDFQVFIDRCLSAGVVGAVVCGCHPGDWAAVEQLETRLRSALSTFTAYPQYGLHPWWVKTRPDDWLERLKTFLIRHPQSGVGEIGLDAHFPDLAPMDDQILVCEQQLLLAWEFDRPVTVHCLKAHNEFLLILKKYPKRSVAERKLNPGGTRLQSERKHAKQLADLSTVPIVLHMFTGSEEYVKAYCKYSENIYFSVFSKGPKGSLIQSIPMDRLVVETDSPFQPAQDEEKARVMGSLCGCMPPALREQTTSHRINDPSQLLLSVQRIASAKVLPFDEVARITRQNTIAAFRLR